ncbi:MAG: hypothetical protein ACRDSR_10740 [Pseudonocardiaceae bacterium]
MTVARFQVVQSRWVAARELSVPSPSADLAPPRPPGFIWRFMSANNRTLAKSAQAYPDVESCLAAIRILRHAAPRAVGETARNGNGQWVWQARVAGEVVATTTRSYQRQVRARLRCDSFLELVAEMPPSVPVPVIYR